MIRYHHIVLLFVTLVTIDVQLFYELGTLGPKFLVSVVGEGLIIVVATFGGATGY